MDPIDPDAIACGPATPAVRALLQLAAATRWFEPSAPVEPSWLEAHLAAVRAHVPDAFAARVEVTHEGGGWDALEALAARVRGSRGFDWKFGVLKPMVREHSRARGWTPLAHARAFQAAEPAPADLFVPLNEHAFWRPLGPRVDFRHAGSAREAAGWYHGFAHVDLTDAIEWQLAEGAESLEGNPFWPLLRGYAAGQYPFVLDAARAVVLRFEPRLTGSS